VNVIEIISTVTEIQALLESGTHDASKIIDSATDLIRSHPDTEIDYIAICDPETLVDVKTIDRPVRMVLAVIVGKARLIDDMLLKP
jgi:pantoate--beta-alanine ligase